MPTVIGESASSGALEQGNPLKNVAAVSINMDSDDSGKLYCIIGYNTILLVA